MSERKVTSEVAAATAAVRAAMRTAFADQTAFVMKVMRMVNAVEAMTAEQFAADVEAYDAEAMAEAMAS